MATRVTLDRNEARKLVETIARGHGHIPADMLAAMPPDIRLVVEEALRKKDDMIASSVFTYSTTQSRHLRITKSRSKVGS